MSDGPEIVVGVTGGVAAFKTAAMVSHMVKRSARVTVVMTESARNFVGPSTFSALTGRPVHVGLWDDRQHPLGPHIELAAAADLLCIAPATANFMAKAAHGIADDLLSTLYLAFGGPVVMAPAMNSMMWEQNAVQRNVSTLRDDGVHFAEPGEGWLSCRQTGTGRMAEPEQILDVIHGVLDRASAG